MKHRPLKQLCGLLATAAIALVLIGCNGKDGATGATGATGAAGTPGAPGAPGTPGANGGQVINVPALTAAEWSALSLTGTVTGVTVPTTGAITPTVKFKVINQNGVPVVGLGQNGPDGYNAHLAFTIAKFVPQSTNATYATTIPSHWVNYEFVQMPTTAVPTGSITRPRRIRNQRPPSRTTATALPSYAFALDLGQAAEHRHRSRGDPCSALHVADSAT